MTGEMRAERDDGALESRVGVMPADGRDDDYELVMQARIHVACDVVHLPHAAPCEEHAVHSHDGAQRGHRPDEGKDPAENACMCVKGVQGDEERYRKRDEERQRGRTLGECPLRGPYGSLPDINSLIYCCGTRSFPGRGGHSLPAARSRRYLLRASPPVLETVRTPGPLQPGRRRCLPAGDSRRAQRSASEEPVPHRAASSKPALRGGLAITPLISNCPDGVRRLGASPARMIPLVAIPLMRAHGRGVTRRRPVTGSEADGLSRHLTGELRAWRALFGVDGHRHPPRRRGVQRAHFGVAGHDQTLTDRI